MACNTCGTIDESLFPREVVQPKCFDCRSYYRIVKGKHECWFTLQEFKDWKNAYGRACVYCGIDGLTLWDLAISVPGSGFTNLQYIGVDRMNNALGYSLDNIVACCYPCNKIKSNLFTFDEMRKIGLALQEVWKDRIDAEAFALEQWEDEIESSKRDRVSA